MTYTVVWRPSAVQQLAELWLNAADRQPVTYAADMIDALLRTNPMQVGESREQGVRILTVSPLSVYYDVSEADRTVVVWAVWQSSRL